MMNWKIVAFALAGVLIVGVGCSDDPKDSNNHGNHDLGDVGQVDVGGQDSGDEDVLVEADVEADVDDGEEEVPVTISSGGKKFPFTHAAYGLTSAEKTEDGVWEIYVELWEGSFTGCPVETSPTPYRQMILYGLSVGDADELVVEEQPSLTLLDYRGEVFPALEELPFIRASLVAAEGKSWEFCKECISGENGGGKKNGELVVDLQVMFDLGGLEGTFRAQHCPSMDVF